MIMLFTGRLFQVCVALPHNNNATLATVIKDLICTVIIKQLMEESNRC